jgi:hypothetical protein
MELGPSIFVIEVRVTFSSLTRRFSRTAAPHKQTAHQKVVDRITKSTTMMHQIWQCQESAFMSQIRRCLLRLNPVRGVGGVKSAEGIADIAEIAIRPLNSATVSGIRVMLGLTLNAPIDRRNSAPKDIHDRTGHLSFWIKSHRSIILAWQQNHAIWRRTDRDAEEKLLYLS